MSIDNPIDAATRIEQVSQQSSVIVGIHELTNIVNDFKSHNDAATTQAFCKKLGDKLQSDKLLPQLAVAWAHENVDTYGHNGEISQMDLNMVPLRSTCPMDRQFALIIRGQFDKLRNMHKDGWFGTSFMDKDGITKADLDATMQTIETTRKQQNQTQHDQTTVRDLTKGLAANGDDLFKKIANMHNQRTKDNNFITFDDAWRAQQADQDLRQQSDGQKSLLTDDQKKTVDGLIKNWYSSPELRAAEQNYQPKDPSGTFVGALTLDGIAKASGYKGADELNKAAGGSAIPAETKTKPVETKNPADNKTKPAETKNPADTKTKPAETKQTPADTKQTPADTKQTPAELPHKLHLLPRPKEADHDNELSVEMPRWGEGYIRIAQRLLGKDAGMRDVMDLTQTLEDLNGNKPVIYGRAVKIPEKYRPTAPNPPADWDENGCLPNEWQNEL